MTAERWTQVKTIFQEVSETAPDKRSALLKEKCAGDAELLTEIASMLCYEDDAEEFFAAPVFNVAVKLLAEEETLPLGARLDNYRIVREIGRGGMGAVYLAERSDGLFDQRVALKIIKRGMDTDQILRRFVLERQILASLDHPNIARLLDGGTTPDGRPYFVMEYVAGGPVDKYCQENNVRLAERLQLFRKICAGVTYAHQHLVIHRDIKPSNILVTADGEPKLLDFGIAKLLHAIPTGETAATATAARFLTPDYAAPEQCAGDKITTQADVFSLGVLLHKLIFGATQATGATQKTGTSRTFDKDLRVILATARRTDTARRYSSAEALADDVRRLLEGLPVLAQADTFFYHASKFVRRNAATVALVSLALVSLVFATVFSLVQTRRASAAQRKAEKRFNDVRKLANQVLFEYQDKIATWPNSTAVRAQMLKDSLAYLDSLAQEAGDDPLLGRELAAAYLKIGEVQGKPYAANLNDIAGAGAHYQKAQAILERLQARAPADQDIQADLSRVYEGRGEIEMRELRLEPAFMFYERAYAVRTQLVAAAPGNAAYQKLLAESLFDLSDVWAVKTAQLPAEKTEDKTAALYTSLEFIRQAAAIFQAQAAAVPDSSTLYALGRVYQRTGYRFVTLGRIDARAESFRTALAEYDKAGEAAQRAAALNAQDARVQRFIADLALFRGEALQELKDAHGALASYEQSRAGFTRLAAQDPANGEAARDVVFIEEYLGRFFLSLNHRSRAAAHFRAAIGILERLAATNPDHSLGWQLTNCRYQLAQAEGKQGVRE